MSIICLHLMAKENGDQKTWRCMMLTDIWAMEDQAVLDANLHLGHGRRGGG